LLFGDQGLGNLSGDLQDKAYAIIKEIDFSDYDSLQKGIDSLSDLGEGYEGITGILTTI